MSVNRSSESFTRVYTPELINTQEKIVATTEEKLQDGAMEEWSDYYYPDGWTMMSFGEAGAMDMPDWNLFNRSTDSYAGTYCWALSTADDGTADLFWATDVTGGGSAGETMQMRGYMKTDDSAALTYAFQYTDGGDEGDTYYYNFTGVNAGTWTIGAGDPTSDQLETFSPTSGWAQYTGTQVTLPGAGVDADSGGGFMKATGGNSKTVLLDNAELLVAGVNVINESTFENWTYFPNQEDPMTEWTGVYGNDWNYIPVFQTGTTASYFKREDTNVQGGTYACAMLVGDSDLTANDDRGYIWQKIEGDAGLDVTPDFYHRASGVVDSYVMFLNDEPGSHTEIFDFETELWDTLSTTVTDLPGTDNCETLSNTTSYQRYNEDVDPLIVPMPDSGKMVMVLMSEKGNEASQVTYYFDTASMLLEVPGNSVSIFKNQSLSNWTDLDSTDKVLEFRTNDGEDILEIDKSGTVTSVVSEWNWADNSIPHKFIDPTEDENPVTKGYFEGNEYRILGSASVDYKSTGTTDIFTVPSGKKAIVTDVSILTTAADTVSNDSVASLGGNDPDYNDVASTITQPSSSTNKIVSGALSAEADIMIAGITVKLNVTTADTGTDLDATVYVRGFLIDN